MNLCHSVPRIVVCLLALSQSTVASSRDATEKEPADVPARNVKFVLEDKPIPVRIERIQQGLRYAAVVRGFASLLVNGTGSDDTVDAAALSQSDLRALIALGPPAAAARLLGTGTRSLMGPPFQSRYVVGYDEHLVPPRGKHVYAGLAVGNLIQKMRPKEQFQPNVFLPAVEKPHPPLQEYVFYSDTAEGAKRSAADFLEVYDHGFLPWLGKLADKKKRELMGVCDEAVPKLADLQEQVDKTARELEGIEQLGKEAMSDLNVKRSLLKVEIAGIKARLSTIEDKIKGTRDDALRARLVELEATAEIDMASLSAQQKALDELIDGQRRLGALGMLKIQKLYPLRDAVKQAERELPRCEEVLADLIPFQLVDDTVVIRPVTLEPNAPATAEK